MSLEAEENDPFRPNDNDPVRKLWGQFNGPDYDIEYMSPYEIPASAYDEDVWFDESDPSTECRTEPPRAPPAKTKTAPPARSEPMETAAIPRHVETDKAKFISSFETIETTPETEKPPSPKAQTPGEPPAAGPWLALVKEAAALEIAKKEEQEKQPASEPMIQEPEAIKDPPTVEEPVPGPSTAPEDTSEKPPVFSWVQKNLPFAKYQRAGTESEARAAEVAFVDGIVKKGLKQNVLGPIPKAYYMHQKRNLTVKVGNQRVTNTIHFQAALRKVLSLIQNIGLKDNPPNPPKALPAPEPLKTSELKVFQKFKEINKPSVIKHFSELGPTQEFSDKVVDTLLRRSIYLLLAQIGFTATTKKTMQLLFDSTKYYLKGMAKNIASKKRAGKLRREILDESLQDYDTSIDELKDYYLEDVVKREQNVYNKYIRTHNKYWGMVKTKRQKLKPQRSARGGVIIKNSPQVIPELHVPDRPEGFEHLPNLGPGMEILQTLEQEAESLRLQEYMNSPSDAQASGSAQIPFPLPVLELSKSPTTSSDLTGIRSVHHLPSRVQQASGLQDAVITEYITTPIFDCSEAPGGSNLIAEYSVSPSTSVATITSSPGTPAPSGSKRKRKR